MFSVRWLNPGPISQPEIISFGLKITYSIPWPVKDKKSPKSRVWAIKDLHPAITAKPMQGDWVIVVL